MKQMTRILCLLLALLLLVGCAPSEGNNDSTAAPEDSGAVLATGETEPTEVQDTAKLEQTLADIKALGESPDDNYRTRWHRQRVFFFLFKF